MPAWRELQAVFRGAMLGGEDGALAGLVLDDGLSASARLRLYRNHVASTLTDTLRAAYPVVARLVGGGFFAYAVDRYLRDHPPAGPCLFEYGNSFAGFLAGFAPCAHLAYLPDVARLEWALHAARYAPDARPLAADALRTLPPAAAARLTFRFHPSVSLLESRWPTARTHPGLLGLHARLGPDTQRQDLSVLRRIVHDFGGVMALDCAVLEGGRITVGDPVTLR